MGGKYPSSKLDPDRVRTIRWEYWHTRITQKELAHRYGVGTTTIFQAIWEETWREEDEDHERFRPKLDWESVRDIRNRYRDTNVTQVQLAREYGVTAATVNAVIRGQTWREPDYALPTKQAKSRGHKLSSAQAQEIRERYWNTDITQTRLAADYGVSVPAIHYILANRYYRD